MAGIRVISVYEGDTVEIQWTLRDGGIRALDAPPAIYYQRVTIPPKATREAKDAPRDEAEKKED